MLQLDYAHDTGAIPSNASKSAYMQSMLLYPGCQERAEHGIASSQNDVVHNIIIMRSRLGNGLRAVDLMLSELRMHRVIDLL